MKHEIKLGDKLIATIETHDGAVVTILEPQREVAEEKSLYKFKKGDRVRSLISLNNVKARATGTVDEDSVVPFVVWDCEDMVTDNFSFNLRRCLNERYLELITDQVEVTEAHSSLVLDELQNRVSGEALEMGNPDYSHLIGKWVYSTWHDHYKWVKIIGEYDGLIENLIVQVPNAGKEFLHISWLNLSDPRDENPDEPKEVRIPFSIERYDSGDFIRYETRDGNTGFVVRVGKDREARWPVVVTTPDDIYTTNINGFYVNESGNSRDLFMVIKEGDK